MRGRDKGSGGVHDSACYETWGRTIVLGLGGMHQVLSIIRMTGTHCHWEFDNEEVIEPVNSTGVALTHWEAVR